MKKSILMITVIAFIGVFSVTSCKNNKKKEGNDKVENAIDEKSEDQMTPTEPETPANEEEMKQSMNQDSGEKGKEENQKNEDDKKEAQKMIDDAVKKIKTTGNAFVKSIKDNDSKAEIEKAQDKFQSAVQNAQDAYQKVSGMDVDMNLNKAQKSIQQASNQVQQQAKTALQQRGK